MRLNPFVLVATVLIGLVGVVFTVRAYTTYDDASEAFTHVGLEYVADSFTWQDSEYDQGTARFRIVNDSSFTATVETFSISLRFDGEFAGSYYPGDNPWQAIDVPDGGSTEITIPFTVTANSIQDEGGSANLGFAGNMTVKFAEFEQKLNFRFRGDMGKVDYVGSQ